VEQRLAASGLFSLQGSGLGARTTSREGGDDDDFDFAIPPPEAGGLDAMGMLAKVRQLYVSELVPAMEVEPPPPPPTLELVQAEEEEEEEEASSGLEDPALPFNVKQAAAMALNELTDTYARGLGDHAVGALLSLPPSPLIFVPTS
jgi:hypothetical protein